MSPFNVGTGLPSIKVAKTKDNNGVKEASQISVVSLEKILNKP